MFDAALEDLFLSGDKLKAVANNQAFNTTLNERRVS